MNNNICPKCKIETLILHVGDSVYYECSECKNKFPIGADILSTAFINTLEETKDVCLNKKPFVIGLVGHARAGKDTVYEMLKAVTCCYKLEEQTAMVGNPPLSIPIPTKVKSFIFNMSSMAIADPIRDIAKAMGFSKEQLILPELKQDEDKVLGISPRVAMQNIGKMMRSTFGEDIFLKILNKKIEASNDSVVVITDIRMPIEAEYVKANKGILVKVNRPSIDLSLPMYQHDTELNVDSIVTDCKIDNDSGLEELREKVLTLSDFIYMEFYKYFHNVNFTFEDIQSESIYKVFSQWMAYINKSENENGNK